MGQMSGYSRLTCITAWVAGSEDIVGDIEEVEALESALSTPPCHNLCSAIALVRYVRLNRKASVLCLTLSGSFCVGGVKVGRSCCSFPLLIPQML